MLTTLTFLSPVRNGPGVNSVALTSLAWRGHPALPPVGVTDQAAPEAVPSTSPAVGPSPAQRGPGPAQP